MSVQAMSVEAWLKAASQRLAREGVEAGRLTAEVLLARALGCDRSYLIAHALDELSPHARSAAEGYLTRRSKGEPTQYITGTQEFYGRPFAVGPGVLIPRPETEHVVERALELAPPAGATVIDVCTGSGAIGITLALEWKRPVILADISPPALHYARRNAQTLRAPCPLIQADLLTAFHGRRVDLVVANPPYIAEAEELPREVRDHEPALALFAGPSGNSAYARIIQDARRVLRPGGWLVMELGWQSAAAVQAMLTGPAWDEITVQPDLAGRDRVISARWAAAR